MKNLITFDEFLNESKELELGVKYVYTKTDEVGYINTGGSNNPKYWQFLVSIQGRGKNSGKLGVESYPYEEVKKYLKLAKDQKGGGFEDYLNKGGRVWDNENEEFSKPEKMNEADMTKFYDGFILYDMTSKKEFKSRYVKGVKNNVIEGEIIKNLAKEIGSKEAAISVHKFIKKGEYDKTDITEVK